MSRGTAEEALLKKEYAAASGVALRTARLHAAKNHPSWQEFLAARAITLTPSAPAAERVQPITGDPARAADAADRAWSDLKRLEAEFALTSDPVLLPQLKRAIERAHLHWTRAREDARTVAEREGLYISRERLQALLTRLLPGLCQVHKGYRARVAQQLPPAVRVAFFNASDGLDLKYWTPAIKALDAELTALLAGHA